MAQTPSPWSGVIRDDAEQAAGAVAGYSTVRQRGMSADGRFLVIESGRTLVDGDTNGAFDIFLRDRQTGFRCRHSVSARHIFTLSASDHAGNTSSTGVGFTIIATVDTLIGAVNSFVSTGQIDAPFGRSLLPKLQDANLHSRVAM